MTTRMDHKPRVSLWKWAAIGAAVGAIVTTIMFFGIGWIIEATGDGDQSSDPNVHIDSVEIGTAYDLFEPAIVGVIWGAAFGLLAALVVNYKRPPSAK